MVTAQAPTALSSTADVIRAFRAGPRYLVFATFPRSVAGADVVSRVADLERTVEKRAAELFSESFVS